MFKPFKPPLLKSVAKSTPIDLTESDGESQDRHTKRRRLTHVILDSSPRTKSIATTAINAPRKPLMPLKNPTMRTQAASPVSAVPDGYYLVLWRKFTSKKHKTWDGDGVLSVCGGYARLQDISGRELGRCVFKDPLLPGSILSIGQRDVEVDQIITKADYLAGRPFLKAEAKRTPSNEDIIGSSRTASASQKSINVKAKDKDVAEVLEIPAKSFYAIVPKTTAMKAHFKNPLLSTTVMPPAKHGVPTPRHDPNAPGALVMKRPKDCPKGKQIVDVVLDPFLGQHLRKHQKEGVKFLYECVMGLRSFNGQGALLADEMGLGKTLQTIALLWTLLKQNPIHGSDGVIKKALIVCPVTLIVNWKKEFQKWLGNERIGVFVADGQNTKLSDFTHGKSYSVMIIGYEKLRSVQDELKKGAGIDIVVADEGHRLKTAQNKSAQAIRSLNTPMRIILSGTPLQNDLSEFFIMVDFVNPGLLGSYNTFKKEFESPILKSRQPGASEKDIEKGSARGEELAYLTKMFILRRNAEILSEYLPPKTEYVLFCKPTQAQAQVYQHVLESPFCNSVIGSSEAALQLITILKKVCNSPSLLITNDKGVPNNANIVQLLDSIPTELLRKTPVAGSSKFRILDRMLKYLSANTSEKIVLVSNYTSTLDLLANHLSALGLTFLRLDGNTQASKRQDLVDSFNRTPASKNFAFLLSAKSGGAGINLIGASRLILFDVDWNPATDLQAMARIHRDGQKHAVKIYRFLLAGGMDEKIYQRQVSKMGLADSVVDGKKNEASFSVEELRDLFKLKLDTGCQSHDLLGCDCKGLGIQPIQLSDPSEPIEENDSEDDGSDGSEEFPVNPSYKLIQASKVNMAAQEKKILEEVTRKRKAKSKGQLQALMQYVHIDTSVFRGETTNVFGFENDEVTDVKRVIDDKLLVNVMEDKASNVTFVFAKKG